MRHSPLSIGLGLVIGVVGGWIGAGATEPSSATSIPDAISRGAIGDRSAEIERKIDALGARFERFESAMASPAATTRTEFGSNDTKLPDLPGLLDRLKAEIDRFVSMTAESPLPRTSIEAVASRFAIPQDWTQLERLHSVETQASVKLFTMDQVLRCFGKPTRSSGDEHGSWWYYVQGPPSSQTIGIVFHEGRVTGFQALRR